MAQHPAQPRGWGAADPDRTERIESMPTQAVPEDFVPTQAVPVHFVSTSAVPPEERTEAVPTQAVPTWAVPTEPGPTRAVPSEWPAAGGKPLSADVTEPDIWGAGSVTGTGQRAVPTGDAGPATGHGAPTARAAARTGSATARPGEVRFGPGVPAAPPTAPAWPRRPAAAARRRSPARLVGSILSTVLTLVLVGAVGLYLWQRLRPLEVESVTAAVPKPPGQTCDTTVDVVATVRTNGNAGTLSYQWFRTGAEPSGVLDERVARGQRTVTLHLAWAFSGVGTTTQTATVNIISPSPAQAATSVTYTCPRR